ncbi:MAG: hypothetical protein C5B49_06340 [Bdellovibrio sp.]|nr:MAG: hypothetical protein C5B49_06340 [Bdellovibrio sp.]
MMNFIVQNRAILSSILFTLITGQVSNARDEAHGGRSPIPHFDLDMTGAEWEKVLKGPTGPTFPIQSPLDEVLRFGKRNLDWLRVINDHRDDKVSFTSEATQAAHPIDDPIEYNETLIMQAYGDLIQHLPARMRAVLVEQAPMTEDPGLDLLEYLSWGRKADVVYQKAARWLIMQRYLDYLKSRRSEDVRGYYNLRKDTEREEHFAEFNSLSDAQKKTYSDWLLGICMNARQTQEDCAQELKQAILDQKVNSFYAKYFHDAEDNWNSFFDIPQDRKYPEILWDSRQPNLTRIAFMEPETEERRQFLQSNIQDEWRWLGWALQIDFSPSRGVLVKWQEGITPHVDHFSNTIFMDANSPLTEYNVRWTIRHEFGHILGFPDCYLEFYDEDRAVMVQYQLDITDLMCSRRGKLKERHWLELQRNYLH